MHNVLQGSILSVIGLAIHGLRPMLARRLHSEQPRPGQCMGSATPRQQQFTKPHFAIRELSGRINQITRRLANESAIVARRSHDGPVG
jgi:hypothetical protein